MNLLPNKVLTNHKISLSIEELTSIQCFIVKLSLNKITEFDSLQTILQRVHTWYEISEKKNQMFICIEADVVMANQEGFFSSETCIFPILLNLPSHWKPESIDWNRSFGEVQIEGNSIALRLSKIREAR